MQLNMRDHLVRELGDILNGCGEEGDIHVSSEHLCAVSGDDILEKVGDANGAMVPVVDLRKAVEQYVVARAKVSTSTPSINPFAAPVLGDRPASAPVTPESPKLSGDDMVVPHDLLDKDEVEHKEEKEDKEDKHKHPAPAHSPAHKGHR